METRTRKAGKPVVQVPEEELPKASQAELGIAAISAVYPEQFILAMNEKRFNPNDILDPFAKAVVEVVVSQRAKNGSTDIRVLFERLRERLPQIEFFQVSNLYTEGSVLSALPEMIEMTRDAAKRRALLGLVTQAKHDIPSRDAATFTLISNLISEAEGIARELNPPKPSDTSSLLMLRLKCYESGDDSTQIIKTGFENIDNLTPIREGDLLVIGGETKSGKTIMALNIVANILCHETTT